MVAFNWLQYAWKTTFDFHCLLISFKYHNVLNFAASSSKGSRYGNVAPSGSSLATKAISIRSQLKWNSCP
jgi:hypothetical protein